MHCKFTFRKNTFVWYRWLFSPKKIVTWSIFIEEMITHYEDTKRNTFFSQLINIKKKGLVVENIEDFLELIFYRNTGLMSS